MKNLEPKEVFAIFEQITKVPRPSKHEEQIGAWLMQFAKEHHLAAKQDPAGNVIISCPATAGKEDHPGVILQAHMDMVCEKNGDVKHDFRKDPIDTYIEEDFIKARGTTLGGDDGIGMAMALAAVTSTTLEHPAIECLFTVDEETGLTGAEKLQDGWLSGKRLINIDSEDDGQVFIGCAGGVDTVGKKHFAYETIAPDGLFAARISVTGLMGGHSGDDINKGRANANKLLVRFLYELSQTYPMHIADWKGGNLRNAIAREAEAVVVVKMVDKENLRVALNRYIATLEAEVGDIEKEMKWELESAAVPSKIMPDAVAQSMIRALYACPHGMMAMSKTMPGLVETSTNLASVRIKEDEKGTYMEVTTSQRSSVDSKINDIRQMVTAALSLACDEVISGNGYPGWNPNPKSPLLASMVEAYEELYGEKPQVLAIHAGLECGLFLEKYPYWDMVSIGPQMYGVHSPQERLSISSTARCWAWLKHVLEKL